MIFSIPNVNFYEQQDLLNFNEKKRTTSKNIVEPVQLLASLTVTNILKYKIGLDLHACFANFGQTV